jgi:hypothetical protein
VEGTYADAKYLEYPNAQCYGGQTAAQGCVAGVQDLSGEDLPRAPKYTASASGVYDHTIYGAWNGGLNIDLRYSSRYNYIETANPVATQKAFTTLDIGARLHDDAWEFALLGRNITNVYYATSGVDQARGTNGQVYAIVARPREVVLQVTRRF